MLCSYCSADGATSFCPCRDLVYCSKACQTAAWPAHKAEHKHFMRLVAEARIPRQESMQSMMRSPYQRELKVKVNDTLHSGLFSFGPFDSRYGRGLVFF